MMAGGSTHLSTATTPSTGNELCFSSKTAADAAASVTHAAGANGDDEPFPVWTASVPSPGNPGIIFPDDDHRAATPSAPAGDGLSPVSHQQDVVQRKMQQLKEIFHRGRHLLVKHLPTDVTEEEVRSILPASLPPIKSIVIPNQAEERERRSHHHSATATARVFLSDPTFLDTFTPSTVSTTLRNKDQQQISVTFCPSPTEAVLCVAHLPFSMSDEDLRATLEKYGAVKWSFLMRSAKTGESKGYGLVEYEHKESAFFAKSCLDNRSGPDVAMLEEGLVPLTTPTLSCDWLDSSIVSFSRLESQCLCIRGLPADFRDMTELRRIMSCHVNPPYCQIALKQGSPQDFGLVEFENGEQAERTVDMTHGFVFRGKKLSISYCIPGQRAINIYMKILHDHGNRGNSALLPDPTATSVVKRLQTLARNNPVFAQNLQTIILTQIQDIQEGAFKTADEREATSNKWNGTSSNGKWSARGNNNESPNHPKRQDHKVNGSRWGPPVAGSPEMRDEEQTMTHGLQIQVPNGHAEFQAAVSEAQIVDANGYQARQGAWQRPSIPVSVNGNHNASAMLLNTLLQAAEAASTSPRQTPHPTYTMTAPPVAASSIDGLTAGVHATNLRDSVTKVMSDPESLKQLMAVVQEANGTVSAVLPPGSHMHGMNGMAQNWHQQQQAVFNGMQPQFTMLTPEKAAEMSFMGAPLHAAGHMQPQQALLGQIDPAYLIGAPWYAIQAQADPAAMGFAMPPPGGAMGAPPGMTMMAWPTATLQQDMNAYSTHAAVAAQNAAMMRKRKMPPFGYPQQAMPPTSAPMVADPNMFAAASYTFSDPFKRKRQY